MVNERAKAQAGYAVRCGDFFDGFRESAVADLQSELEQHGFPVRLSQLLDRVQQCTALETDKQRCTRHQLEVELCCRLLWRVRTMRRLQERERGPKDAVIERTVRLWEAEVDEALPKILLCCGWHSEADVATVFPPGDPPGYDDNIVLRAE